VTPVTLFLSFNPSSIVGKTDREPIPENGSQFYTCRSFLTEPENAIPVPNSSIDEVGRLLKAVANDEDSLTECPAGEVMVPEITGGVCKVERVFGVCYLLPRLLIPSYDNKEFWE
jgi:hypothetical protein